MEDQSLVEKSGKQKISWQQWASEKANTPVARHWLAFFSFADSTFLPIPPDFLLAALLSSGAKRWLYYAYLTTVTSVLGGILGYAIGYLFFDTVGLYLVDLYNLHDYLIQVRQMYEENAFWTLLFGAFTPIPYKIFTLSAGFFKINFLLFVLTSILGRGARFYIVSFLAHRFGQLAIKRFGRVLLLATLFGLLLLLLYVLIS